MCRFLCCCVLICWTALSSSPVQGETVTELFAETNGDELSNDNLNPTDLGSMVAGLNRVSGIVEDALGDGNVDVFRFAVPTGFVVSGVFVADYGYNSATGDQSSFLGINDGTDFPYSAFEFDEGFFDENEFLGGTTFGIADLGADNDILGKMGTIAGRGFDGPLPADTYTVYIQQTGPESYYTLDFQVTAVPEPVHLSLVVGGMVALVLIRKRSSRGVLRVP